jgi:methionyl aminopeptidase
MSIDSPDDLAGLQRAGRVAATVLEATRRAVRAGVTTAELDAVAAEVMVSHGARSGPRTVYQFPGAICISVNDEAVHGIPGRRRLRPGDLVKLDVTVELDGFFADTAASVPVGALHRSAQGLPEAAWAGLEAAMNVATAGTELRQVGRAIEHEVRRHGCSVLPELTGHGIGRTIHEPPTVPQHWDPRLPGSLHEGLVITIEPIISAGGRRVRGLSDGWTVVTADGSPSAHVEHTVVITSGRPLILTTLAAA